MSEYTMQLNEVVVELEEAGTSLFDFEYTLPDFMVKENLQTHFLAHYYFREIGFETISRFLQRFRVAWLEKLKEYDIKFKLVNDKLTTDNMLNTYEDNLEDTNTFKATPMSSMQEGRNYNTSINNLVGKHTGYKDNGNVFKNITSVLGEHSEVVNNFINEFDYLFMGVL